VKIIIFFADGHQTEAAALIFSYIIIYEYIKSFLLNIQTNYSLRQKPHSEPVQAARIFLKDRGYPNLCSQH
jgi:hypothetical protein